VRLEKLLVISLVGLYFALQGDWTFGTACVGMALVGTWVPRLMRLGRDVFEGRPPSGK
jgi:multisubunit Na+/H+ antiporter MnhE subunit